MSRLSRAALAAFAVALALFTSTFVLAQDHESPTPAHAPTAKGHDEHGGATAKPGEHSEGAHEGAAHEGGAHHGPEAINWTDIWDKKRPAVAALVINFGVLMTLYYMLGKKPISDGLKQRRATIGKDIEEAQKLLAEAEERAKKYQGDLKNADVDAATAKASLISSGKGEVERLVAEAEERAVRMKKDAERLVEQERKQVHLDLVNETVELAVHEAAQLLAKSVTADDHARLANDLLAELSRRPASRAARPGGAA